MGDMANPEQLINFINARLPNSDIPRLDEQQPSVERVYLLRSPQILAERGQPIDVQTANEAALAALYKFYAPKEGFGRGMIRSLEFGQEMHYTDEMLRMAYELDLSQRGVNALRLDLLLQDDGSISPFGELLNNALENPALVDHNHHHLRRVEQTLLAIILNSQELQTEDAQAWYRSAFLAASLHDNDQLISLQRNTLGEHLSVKKGHALAGAVMAMLFAQRYARECGLDPQEAERIVRGAAYMILKHDEPERISQALDGNRNAHGLHGEELYKVYQENLLDLTTLSPKQLIEMLRYEKGKAGFTSFYGLSEECEKEYQAQLELLEVDDNPLLQFSVAENNKKEALKLMTEVVVFADIADMVAPPYEAIYRTLMTQYSQKRPFFTPVDEEFIKYVQLELKNAGKDKLSETASKVDYYVALIENGSGNTPTEYVHLDSDVRRLLFEFHHLVGMNSSRISRLRYIREMNSVNAMMGIYALGNVAERIMTNDYSVIQASERRQLYNIAKKMYRRSNPALNFENIDRESRNVSPTSEPDSDKLRRIPDEVELQRLEASLKLNLDPKDAAQYNRLKQLVKSVTQHTIDSIKKKPSHAYSEEDIVLTKNIIQRLITRIADEFQHSLEEQAIYRKNSEFQESTWLSPFSSYLSTEDNPYKGRTIYPPRKMSV